MNDGVIFMEFDQNNKKYSKDDLNKIISENEDIIKKLNSDLSEKNTLMSRTKSYLFDLEFLCRCLGLCLAILIETSKESPHITEINLEALSAAEIKYFFFNDTFNDNIKYKNHL